MPATPAPGDNTVTPPLGTDIATPAEYNASLAADSDATTAAAALSSAGTTSPPMQPAETPSWMASSPSVPPAAEVSSSDTQPVSYAVKRWDAGSSEPETPRAFTPPPARTDPSAPTMPIAPPPVPPSSYPYTYSDMDASSPSASSSSNATMPLPQRSESGTYVPYTTEATKHLESTKRDTRAWLIPSVIVGVLLLLVVGSVGGFLVLNGQKPNAPSVNTSPTQVTTSNQSTCDELLAKSKSNGSTASTEDGLKALICQSNNEQIKAWRELDTEVLKGTRTGQALTENIEAVQELKNKNMYAVPDNKSIEFGEVTMNETTATAKTVEVWTVIFYNKDNNAKVLSQGPDTLREVYHFVKKDGKWLITSVDIVPNAPPVTPGQGDT